MLLLAKYIARHELKPLLRYLSLEDLVKGARKVQKSLAVEIKSPRAMPGFKYFKVRIGERSQARMIAFLLVANGKVVPLLIRLKKDKVFGTNMSMNNRDVVDALNKNLSAVLENFAEKDYREFEL